jgi:hypothetical protein
MPQPRRRKLGPRNLPQMGTVFAIPLPDQRFGACVILAVRTPTDPGLLTFEREFAVFAVATVYLKTSLPTPADVCANDALTNARGELCGVWMGEAPPDNFIPVGVASVANDLRAKIRNSYSGWGWIVGTIRREVLRLPPQDSSLRAASARSEVRQDHLDVPFSDWGDVVPKATLAKARRIVSETLVAVTRASKDHATVRDALRSAIQQFNDLDEKKQFINSLEREDILDVLERIAKRGGVHIPTEDFEELRDW